MATPMMISIEDADSGPVAEIDIAKADQPGVIAQGDG